MLIILIKNAACDNKIDLTKTLKVVYKNWFVGYCEAGEKTFESGQLNMKIFESLNGTDCSKAIHFKTAANLSFTNAEKTEGYYNNYPRGVCEYVKKTEKCVPKFIFNLNKLYYCTFRQNFCSRGSLYLFIPISFFIMFFALHLLGSSADEYLTASLE